MSVTRINRFTAADGMAGSLRDFLTSIVPLIERAAGCEGCQLLQSHEDPNEFVVLEVWTSVEAHQASVRGIPPETISTVMPLLAAPPSGGYYAPPTG